MSSPLDKEKVEPVYSAANWQFEEMEVSPKAKREDSKVLVELFELHGPVVSERIARQIPARWAALLSVDDVMQEAYTDAFLHVDGFVADGPDSFRRWLTTLAKNNLRNAIAGLEAQKRGGDRLRVESHNPGESFMALCELISGTGGTPSGQAAVGEAKADLERAIAQLPPDHRTVILMYDLQGCSVEAVASALKRSLGAVFMLRARAHQALRRLMGGSSKYFSSAS